VCPGADGDEPDARLDQAAGQQEALAQVGQAAKLAVLALAVVSRVEPIPLADPERTRVKWCACRASIGRCSQNERPGTVVAIGLNSPRISSGASGFMSQRSWWAGPPSRKKRMTDLARARPAVLARSSPGKVSRSTLAPPTRSTSRRLTPSHRCRYSAVIRSIARLSPAPCSASRALNLEGTAEGLEYRFTGSV
jgi:hypothetical protein